MTLHTTIRSICLVLGALAPAILLGEEPARIELTESVTDSRAFRVQTRVELSGQVQTPALDGKAVALKLQGTGTLDYFERRLPGAGRDALAYRSVRRYDRAGGKITVAEQLSQPALRDGVRLIVAGGKQDGLEFFSPSGPLTAEEVELLRGPGDSLSILAILPDKAIETGEEWKPADWVLQFLVGVEAVEKSSLVCRLNTVTEETAEITLDGKITGGILGAGADIQLTGKVIYNRPGKYLSRIELTQVEKRSVGSVSPGLAVTAKVTIERSPAADGGISDAELKGVPLESNAATEMLAFESAEWGVRIYHGRTWHLFFPGPPSAVFRMMDKGALIAQCNIQPIRPAAPGKHVAEEDFQSDVQRTLGEDFLEIVQADQVKTQDNRYIYRVTATGRTKSIREGKEVAIPLVWTYYLVAAPDGRQIVLVFTVEASLMERFGAEDVSIATALEFLPASKVTAKPPKP